MQWDVDMVSRLIGKVYEAALDKRQWPVFFEDFATTLKSHAGLVWSNDFVDRTVDVGQSAAFSASHGFSESDLRSFADYYGERNVWLEDSRLHREGAVVTSESLYDPSRLKKTEYWTDWLRPQDIFHSAAAIVNKRNERSVNITLVRSEGAGAYSPDELHLFRILMPHFQAAFEMHRRLHRLDTLAACSMNVLEALPFGVVLLNAERRVLHASTKALAFANHAGCISFCEGRAIACARPADADQVNRLVAGAARTGRALSGEAGGVARLVGKSGVKLQLVVVPLPSWSGPFGVEAASAVFVSDERSAVDGSFEGLLRAAYGLTPTEAILTEALVNGRTVQSYAQARQVSVATARSQMRAVMAKVGVARQSDLVRVVLTGPALLRWPDGLGRAGP